MTDQTNLYKNVILRRVDRMNNFVKKRLLIFTFTSIIIVFISSFTYFFSLNKRKNNNLQNPQVNNGNILGVREMFNIDDTPTPKPTLVIEQETPIPLPTITIILSTPTLTPTPSRVPTIIPTLLPTVTAIPPTATLYPTIIAATVSEKKKVPIPVQYYNNRIYYCYEDGVNTISRLDSQIGQKQSLYNTCSNAVNHTAHLCDDNCKLQYNCDKLYLSKQWDECMAIQDKYKACLDACSIKFNNSLNECVSAYSSQSSIAELNIALSHYCP